MSLDDHHLQRIYDRLDAIQAEHTKTQTALRTWMAAQAQACLDRGKRVTRMERALFGNGAPGVVRNQDAIRGQLRQVTWTLRTSAVALIGILLKALHDVFAS